MLVFRYEEKCFHLFDNTFLKELYTSISTLAQNLVLTLLNPIPHGGGPPRPPLRFFLSVA